MERGKEGRVGEEERGKGQLGGRERRWGEKDRGGWEKEVLHLK